jgi:hypothetical protein
VPQKGWIINKQRMEHQEAMDYAATYPLDFPYDPEMLDAMFNREERGYISPTMLSGCRRQQVLKMHTPYYVYPYHAWTRYRGTLAHLLMEKMPTLPNVIRETKRAVMVRMEDGTQAPLYGTPDKVVTENRLLVDYKTMADLLDLDTEKGQKKLRGWTQQLSVYRWMLAKNGLPVEKAIIQGIHMKEPFRLEVPLWSMKKTERYLQFQMPRWIPVFDGTYNMDNLPPILYPEKPEDEDIYWLCNSSWCEVSYKCKQLHQAEAHQKWASEQEAEIGL